MTPHGLHIANVTRGLLSVDAMLLKLVGGDGINPRDPGYTQRMTVELRLRSLLQKTYARRASDGIALAVDGFVSDSAARPIAIRQDVDDAMAVVAGAFDGWAVDVGPSLAACVREVYGQGRGGILRNAAKRSGVPVSKAVNPVRRRIDISPAFSVIDEQAVSVLASQHTFWVGSHYGANLSERVRYVVSNVMIQSGLPRTEAARVLKTELAAALGMGESQFLGTIPMGWTGSADQYLEGLAANAVTAGRVTGSFVSLKEVGATLYVVVNPGDERTCDVCEFMDGMVLPADEGYSAAMAEASMTDPMAVKDHHPWHDLETMLSRTGASRSNAGAAVGPYASNFIAAGYGYPTYHMNCRCTIDIADESYLANIW